MLKETITYTDYDGDEQTDTLWFNLSKVEITENLHLEDRFKTMNKIFQDKKHEMTLDEVQLFLDLVKLFMELSYGERSGEDNKRFRKVDDNGKRLFAAFKESAAYDAFLFDLFSQPIKIIQFINGCMPQDVMKQAQEQIDNGTVEIEGQVDDRPLWIQENRDPTDAELSKMTKAELAAAMRSKMSNRT